MGRSGTGACAGYALSSHFCYVGSFGDLGDPELPTVRGCRDIIYLQEYEKTVFGVCSCAEGRSKPVPKTRSDCFHQ